MANLERGESQHLDETPEPKLTLDDLLNAESSVLRRLGQDRATRTTMAGHYSSTGGHNSSGSHSSHTSAKTERPLE